MAQRQTSPGLNTRQELIAALDQSRSKFSANACQLGDALNVTRKIEASFRAHRYWWIGGGVAAGFIIARGLIPSLRSKPGHIDSDQEASRESGALFGLLEFAGKQIIRLSRPVLKKMVEKEVVKWVSNMSKSRQNLSES